MRKLFVITLLTACANPHGRSERIAGRYRAIWSLRLVSEASHFCEVGAWAYWSRKRGEVYRCDWKPIYPTQSASQPTGEQK